MYAQMLQFGPNGGLVYCMEYLMTNIEVPCAILIGCSAFIDSFIQ